MTALISFFFWGGSVKEFRLRLFIISLQGLFPLVYVKYFHLLWSVPSCLPLWWRLSEGSQRKRTADLWDHHCQQFGNQHIHISTCSVWGFANIYTLYYPMIWSLSYIASCLFALVNIVGFKYVRLAHLFFFPLLKAPMVFFLLVFLFFQTPSLLRSPTLQKKRALLQQIVLFRTQNKLCDSGNVWR